MKNQLEQLLLDGESQTLEFKSSFDKASIESLVAFANAKGGTVVIGVNNKGKVLGVTLGKETLNEWLGQIKSTTSPTIIPELSAESIDGKIIIFIHISEFPVKPVSTRGRYFKRIASSNHQLGLSEIADLYMQSLQLSWDSYKAPNESLDVLSLSKLTRFKNTVNSSGRFELEGGPLITLEKLKYIVNGQPTWAALLLFSNQPLNYNIHIGRFKTPSMIIDDRQITDTLFEAVELSMKFILSHISVAFEFDGGLQRKERFSYPLPALREALLNAVVHRDYTNPSDIQIKIYDNSITFYSPGHFYGGLKVADVQTDNYQSHLRNKLIAEAFYLTNNIEKYGSGFIRIRKELLEYPEISFQIYETGGGVLLSFTILSKSSVESSVESSEKSSVKILNLLRKNPYLTTNELADKIGVGKRAIEKQIMKLKVEGKIHRVGPNKGGHWQVLDKI